MDNGNSLFSCITFRLTTESLTAGDEDYVPRTVNITFQPGETGPKSMTVQIIDDHLVEPTEEFKVNLVSSSVPGVRLGEPTSVNIHLQDNDGKWFSLRAKDITRLNVCRSDIARGRSCPLPRQNIKPPLEKF